MGTIKIEFDVPDFDNELNISVTIKKDGEVISTLSPSCNNTVETKLVEVKSDKKKSVKEPKPTIPTTKKMGGNMMDLNI